MLDEASLITCVDLDGGWDEDILNAHLDYFTVKAPERLQVFGGVDWVQWKEGAKISLLGGRQVTNPKNTRSSRIEDLDGAWAICPRAQG